MDIATIGGLIFAAIALVVSITLEDGMVAMWSFIDMPSIFVTIGGGTACAIMSYRLSDFVKLLKVTSLVFTTKDYSKENTIRMLVDLSNKARREGLLALEAEQDKIDDDFVKQSLQLVVDGVEPETIKVSMELELNNLEERHAKGINIYKTMAAQYPAWGMIGTLIGLINLLRSLDNPSAIGPAMSVALVTTFYGSIMANYLCNPAANKLKEQSKEEIQLKEMVIEGILSIQAGENPRIMEHKLKTFLSPAQKARYNEMQSAGDPRGAAGQEAS